LDVNRQEVPVVSGQAFLAKYDIGGEIQWSKWLGEQSVGDEVRVRDLAVDRSGWLYAGGAYTFSQDFDPDPLAEYELPAGLNSNAFLAKYSPDGLFSWAKATSSPSMNGINDVTVTSAGTVMVAGGMRGPIEFNPGGKSWYFGQTGQASFTAEYSADGELGNAYRFAIRYGFSGLATGPSRQTWVVGSDLLPNLDDFDPGRGRWTIDGPDSGGGYVFKRRRV
jgi:hypothetical protein